MSGTDTPTGAPKDFWSRRKAAAKAEAQADIIAAQQAQTARTEAELAAKSDAELLAEAGLPEPEAAQSSEEVRAFLQAALPQRLKDRALRRLWRLNPVLANVDGLVDYGEDFTDAATVVDNLQTLYQVGRGIVRPEDDIIKDPPEGDDENPRRVTADSEEITTLAGEPPEDEATVPSDTAPPSDAVAISDHSNYTENPTHEPEIVTFFDDKSEESTIVATAHRRMRFRFEGS